MTFDQACNLIQEQDIKYLKIEDFNKRRLLSLSDETAPQLVQKLQAFKDSLSGYGKVIFICADEKCKNSSWRDALHWQVTISSVTPIVQPGANMQIPGAIPAGYISASEALMQAKIAELTLQMNFEKRFAEMEKKHGVKPSTADEILKYMPMLGLVMDIDEKKLTQMMGLASLQSTMQGGSNSQQNGIAGLGDKIQETKLTVETTEAENQTLDKIENNLAELATKVSMDDILLLIETLNKKPQLVNTLKTFI